VNFYRLFRAWRWITNYPKEETAGPVANNRIDANVAYGSIENPANAGVWRCWPNGPLTP
jgi:hypothetical protein